MTPLAITIAAAVASIGLLAVVLELIRSRRLRERYALLWLLAGVVLLVFSIWRDGDNTIAGWVGIRTYPPAVLFAIAALFFFAVLLHYATVISQLADQNLTLAQKLALLESRLAELEGRRGEGSAEAAAGAAVPPEAAAGAAGPGGARPGAPSAR